jgi:hypothetical protein
MRLINAHTKRFEEFFCEIPPYAILSHTWDAYEIPFKDFYNLQVHEEYPIVSQKIYDTCDRALEDELDYVWIDSCCIDKSSSAELSEAINSMYSWYSKARICYVYLGDYDASAASNLGLVSSDFGKCRWFTRGWTLQELLAPQHVDFYDKNWSYFGTRRELASTLSKIARIPVDVLDGSAEVDEYCVAQKMAWAAKRQTTREEDMAYCLFGLFQINAPLLYGEGGQRAFERLQQEIIKKTNDLTIFAWMDSGPRLNGVTSILASHPGFFSHSHFITPQNPIGGNPEFKVTNKGLKIKTFLYKSNGKILMPLNCIDTTKKGFRLLSISLTSRQDGIFFKTADFGGLSAPLNSQRSEELIYIAMNTKGATLERIVDLTIPLEDGNSQTIQAKAWIDNNYPCNLFSQALAQKYFIAYDSKKRLRCDNTPKGPAYSQGRFSATYTDGKARHFEHSETFQKASRRAKFEVLDVDLSYGIDVIFGRQTMDESLWTMEGHFTYY